MSPARPPIVAIDARYLRRTHVGISVYLDDLIGDLTHVSSVVLLANSDALAHRLRANYPKCEVVALAERRELVFEQRAVPAYLARRPPDAYLAPANRGLPIRSPRGVRLGLVVHDLIPLRNPSYLTRDPLAAARYLFGTIVSVRRADLVIVNSQSTAADVVRLRSGAPIVVRYPSLPKPTIGKGAALPADWPDQFLLYCGGAERRKNVTKLLSAHASYQQGGGRLPLIILGDGFASAIEWYRRSEISSDVRFVGRVDDALKWAAIGRASGMLYPSSFEGFGLPIVEGFITDTPVMTGIGGSQHEVGADAVVAVDGESTREIEVGISRILDPEWRELAIPRGRAQLARLAREQTPAAVLLDHLLG